MAAPQLFFADLVRERCTGTGTGALALDGALPGHRGFAATVPAATLFHYSIAGVTDAAQWETGTGQILPDGRLERVSVSASSAGGALVDFAAGLKTVALTVGASWFSGATAPATIPDVTGLQAALDGKQPAGSYAAATHGHSIANVTNLQASLDARQPISTSHGAATVAAATDTLVIRRGTGWLNLPLGALPLETAAGHVGIGTDTPGCRLEVRGTAQTNGLTVPTVVTAHLVSTETVATAVGPVLGFSGRYSSTSFSTFATIKGALAGGGDGNSASGFLSVTLASAAGAQQERLRLEPDGTLRAGADNAQPLGSPAVRWSTIFAASGAISTSDRRDKADVGALPDAWLDAWGRVQWQRFRFRGGKRWHIGLIAQRVETAFARAGIDAFAIGLLCRDPISGRGRRRDRWGLRYDECLAMEAAWQRREIARLSALVDRRAPAGGGA